MGILLGCALFAWLCFRLCKKILNAEFFVKNRVNLSQFHANLGKNSRHANEKSKFLAQKAQQIHGFKRGVFAVLANLMLLGIVFIGIRGSVGTFPLREDEHHISPNPLINHISTNPIIAFAWALQHYKEQESFESVNLSEFEALQSELFPIFRQNPSANIAQSPNVVVVLMESFGSNMLFLDDEREFDLLMGFREHFEAGKAATQGISNANSQSHLNGVLQNQNGANAAKKGISQDKNSAKPTQTDFTFVNFLSNANGTASSFASLFFISPSANISQGLARDKKLSHTPFAVYKDAGYSVVFITSGKRSWQNLGDFIIAQGADAVYDSNFLMSHYPQSAQNASVYGVLDEFAYKFALETLSNATKPVFIVLLTSSNHPPFPSLPTHFTPKKLNLEPKMPFFTHNDTKKVRAIAEIFAYASNAFGEFIAALKASPQGANTIVAASGDHKHRDIVAFENAALNHAVPLYIYVPSAYTQDFAARGFGFNPQEFGSHKDIFPTLYALSLNGGEFLSLGGRNLFDKNAEKRYKFAINDALWADESCFYPANSSVGQCFVGENPDNIGVGGDNVGGVSIINNISSGGNNGSVNGGFFANPKSLQSANLPRQKADFMRKYKRLEWLQLNLRVLEK